MSSRSLAEASGKSSSIFGSEDAVFDQAAALSRLDDDHSFLVEMAELFVKEGPERLSSMKKALDSRSLDELGGMAHNLKGATSYFVASRTVEAAQGLETAAAQGDIPEATFAFRTLSAELERLLVRLRRLVPGTD